MIHLVMARFQNRLRPVHSIKHVVDSQFAIAAAGEGDLDLIEAVDAPVLANTAQVETGCTVNSIYLKVEVVNTGVDGVFANAYFQVMKNPGGNLADITPNAVGASDNKRYVIHQEMVMLQFQDNSNPRTMFQGVIKIPRGYRRFGINDKLRMTFLAPGVELSVCVQCIYKEYR